MNRPDVTFKVTIPSPKNKEEADTAIRLELNAALARSEALGEHDPPYAADIAAAYKEAVTWTARGAASVEEARRNMMCAMAAYAVTRYGHEQLAELARVSPVAGPKVVPVLGFHFMFLAQASKILSNSRALVAYMAPETWEKAVRDNKTIGHLSADGFELHGIVLHKWDEVVPGWAVFTARGAPMAAADLGRAQIVETLPVPFTFYDVNGDQHELRTSADYEAFLARTDLDRLRGFYP